MDLHHTSSNYQITLSDKDKEWLIRAQQRYMGLVSCSKTTRPDNNIYEMFVDILGVAVVSSEERFAPSGPSFSGNDMFGPNYIEISISEPYDTPATHRRCLERAAKFVSMGF